jgi:cephalosporin-C deacetylase
MRKEYSEVAWFDLPEAELRSYRTSSTEPEGLDTWWSDRLREAEAAATPVILEQHKPEVYGPTPVWDVEFSGARGDRIRGWYLRPAGVPEDEPLPVVVTFVGYGGGRGVPGEHVLLPSVGLATLVMDTRGQGARWGTGATGDGPEGGPELSTVMTRGIQDAERYYYTRLYTDAVRAVTVASQLPGADPDRLGVFGVSQGGGLSLAAAALQPELVTACAADVPFLCDIRRAVTLADTGPYHEVAEFLSNHTDVVDVALDTLDHIDNALLASRIRAETYVSVGLMDDVCPPSTVFAAYNAIPANKQIVVNPFGVHRVSQQHDERRLRFLRQRLAG